MKKAALLIVLLAVVTFSIATSTQAMSPEDAMKKLGGSWVMTKTSDFFANYNMGTPASLYLRPNGSYYFYEITIKGKGYFVCKGNKWEVAAGVEGADAMITMYQTHKGGARSPMGVGAKWAAAVTKVGGPVKFEGDSEMVFNFADLAEFDMPALSDFMNIKWKKK